MFDPLSVHKVRK